jgi:hypothetical protein
MDIQNGSTAQENEGDQQPSEMPNLGEKDKSQENCQESGDQHRTY